MPLLHITVYARVARDAGNGVTPIPMAPPVFEEGVPIELGQSNQSEPFTSQANFVMVKPEVDCCLAFGEDPVAEVGIHPVEAGEIRWYGVHPGHQIAVIEGN